LHFLADKGKTSIKRFYRIPQNGDNNNFVIAATISWIIHLPFLRRRRILKMLGKSSKSGGFITGLDLLPIGMPAFA
jgi:hypothetical protein